MTNCTETILTPYEDSEEVKAALCKLLYLFNDCPNKYKSSYYKLLIETIGKIVGYLNINGVDGVNHLSSFIKVAELDTDPNVYLINNRFQGLFIALRPGVYVNFKDSDDTSINIGDSISDGFGVLSPVYELNGEFSYYKYDIVSLGLKSLQSKTDTRLQVKGNDGEQIYDVVAAINQTAALSNLANYQLKVDENIDAYPDEQSVIGTINALYDDIVKLQNTIIDPSPNLTSSDTISIVKNAETDNWYAEINPETVVVDQISKLNPDNVYVRVNNSWSDSGGVDLSKFSNNTAKYLNQKALDDQLSTYINETKLTTTLSAYAKKDDLSNYTTEDDVHAALKDYISNDDLGDILSEYVVDPKDDKYYIRTRDQWIEATHNILGGRDESNQHSINSITNLQSTLDTYSEKSKVVIGASDDDGVTVSADPDSEGNFIVTIAVVKDNHVYDLTGVGKISQLVISASEVDATSKIALISAVFTDAFATLITPSTVDWYKSQPRDLFGYDDIIIHNNQLK